MTLGCSKQSQIETETGQTNVEKKDQSTNQTNTKTASDNDIVTETVSLKVSGMTWGASCVTRVRSALTKIAGVVKADVAMPNSAVVTINKGEVTNQQLVDAVVSLGGRYQAVLQSTN